MTDEQAQEFVLRAVQKWAWRAVVYNRTLSGDDEVDLAYTDMQAAIARYGAWTRLKGEGCQHMSPKDCGGRLGRCGRCAALAAAEQAMSDG